MGCALIASCDNATSPRQTSTTLSFCNSVQWVGMMNEGSGWKTIHYEGDVQPFGFTQFDSIAGTYRERAGSPTSGPNPGADPDPLDDDTRDLIRTAIAFLGGSEFT